MSNEIILSKQNPQVPDMPIVLDKNQRTWWSSLTEKQRDIIVSFALILGISVVSLITIKFARSKIQNLIANQTENNSFGNDQYATWAKQLKMAFENNGWWGTDEQAIRQVLVEVPSKEGFRKIQVAYRKLYKGKNLIEDMTGELKSTEFNEMLAILQSKPEKTRDAKEGFIYDPNGWAKRLYNAMSIYYMGIFPATDEDAIRAVFREMTNQQAFVETATAYQILYGNKLEEDLDGDLNWTMDWRAILEKKPKS
jgi:hypothetical protein